MTPSHAVVDRYRRLYKVGPDIGAAEVLKHWELEQALTNELLQSAAETRWDTFERCYSRLYSELPWLNAASPGHDPGLSQWLRLIPAGSRIFEIGSGQGRLINYLAAKGFSCTATEITRERGGKFFEGRENLSCSTTDGVHLDRFEKPGSYDVLISTEFVEHLHPEDIAGHFRSAKTLLADGGRYIFTTPHASTGPHDLSAVFGLDKAQCMHLKEYTCLEITAILREAGFTRWKAVFPPSRIYRLVPICFASSIYFQYLMLWDRLERALRLQPKGRKILRKLGKFLLVGDRIWVVAS